VSERDPSPSQLDTPATVDTRVTDTSLLGPVAFPAAGTELGRYVILETLGSGGMGVVLRAYDPRLEREVALKRLRSDVLEPRAAERMEREARAMAQLAHPNVVAVYDVERLETTVLLVMELVRGRTLGRFIRDERPPWPRILDTFLQAGRGLAAAHAAGLVHRDFKPPNVLVGDDGRVRVTDFGLARPVGALGERLSGDDFPSASSQSHSLRVLVTAAGTVMGTPAFMAPEQHVGEDADAHADQYAFCVALWEALTGTRPFQGEHREIAAAKLRGPPPWPPKSPVPKRIAEALARGLASKPSDRWPSMDALLAVLDRAPARQRRRWIIAGSVGAMAAAIGAAAGWWSRGASVCDGAQAHLAGIWDDDRRAQVSEALRATGVDYAEHTLAAITVRLDAYASEWARMHTEACEATAVRGEQSAAVLDLRMGCLHRRRHALEAVVDVLAHADAGVVEQAIPLAAGLPALMACTDVEALRTTMPPPEDPALAQAVERARRELARTEALGDVGKHAEALAILDMIPEPALAHESLRAELELRRGLLQLDVKRYDQAQATLDSAAQRALRLDHRRVAIQALSALGFTIGVRRLQREQGMSLVTIALAMAQSLGDRGLEALVLADMGSVLESHALYDQAIERFEQALAIQRELHGDEHPTVSATLTNLAIAWEGRGELEKAFELDARALELERAIFGEEHPRVARLLASTGIDLHQQGKYEAAVERLEQALAMQERLMVRGHPETAHTLSSLGLALSSLGRNAEAEARLRAAVELLERQLGSDSIEVIDARDNLAIVVDAQGRHEEALALHRRVLAGVEASLGPQHPRTAMALNNVASVLLLLRRPEEALPAMERAIELQRAALGPEDHRIALFEFNTAEALLGLGRAAEAEARLRKALPVVEATFGAEHAYVSYGVVGLGRALLARDDREGALPLLERGVELCKAHGVPETHRAEAAFALARALGDDQRERARSLAEGARTTYERAGPWHARDVEEIDAWLSAHP
jgi:tetratricopeptide (TPR) repeat protein